MNVFELLYVSWRRERQTDILETLEYDFFEKVRPYINHLETIYSNEQDPLIAALFKKRWERANYILNDLINIRMKKHFTESMDHKASPTVLPLEEEEFRKSIEKENNRFRERVVNQLENLPSMEAMDETIEKEFRFMIFDKQENRVAIGSDLREYGPFNIGDIVLLPRENMRNYLKKALGKEISIN
ncbi:MAG: hypothetical protein INQ03_06700 [Candidatus Heimdallarchaeota archaeon]|nr:hypothetical protein [Candidatus Heimdallarchaeota archaeon]